MSADLPQQIRGNMIQKQSDELIAIWKENDRNQYSDITFEAIHQILVERGVDIPEQKTAPEVSTGVNPKHIGVKGWLLFFCLTLTIFSPVSMIVRPENIISILAGFEAGLRVVEEKRIEAQSAMVFLASVGRVAIMLIGIYVGIRLWRLRPGAASLAKWYLFLSLLYHVVPIVLIFQMDWDIDTFMARDLASMLGAGAVYSFVWLLYMVCSRRVSATYSTLVASTQNG